MPYIKNEDRKKFEESIESLKSNISNPGELNYVITKLLHGYIDNKSISYQTLNDVHGVLNCADKELYRRITAPYEDTKIEKNGDV